MQYIEKKNDDDDDDDDIALSKQLALKSRLSICLVCVCAQNWIWLSFFWDARRDDCLLKGRDGQYHIIDILLQVLLRRNPAQLLKWKSFPSNVFWKNKWKDFTIFIDFFENGKGDTMFKSTHMFHCYVTKSERSLFVALQQILLLYSRITTSKELKLEWFTFTNQKKLGHFVSIRWKNDGWKNWCFSFFLGYLSRNMTASMMVSSHIAPGSIKLCIQEKELLQMVIKEILVSLVRLFGGFVTVVLNSFPFFFDW